MGLKCISIAGLVLLFSSNSHGFFSSGVLLDLLAGASGNGTLAFGNGTLQNNSIGLLIAEHIAHTLGSFATIVEIAELLSAKKLIAADVAAEYATNVSSAIGVTLSNYTEAKLNLTNQAAQTVINAGVDLFAIGAEAAALKPTLALGILGAFGR